MLVAETDSKVRYCLAGMTTTQLKEQFGEEIIQICRDDDLSAFKAWIAHHDFTGWTVILRTSTDTDSADIAEYCLTKGAAVDGSVVAGIARGGAARVRAKVLACKSAHINQDEDHHGDALSAAVDWKDLEMVDFCLEHGADPNLARFDFYRTLLSEAAAYSTPAVVRSLLEHGAHRIDSGAVIFAAENGRLDMVELLLEERFNVNEIGIADDCDPRTLEDVGTALHKAIENKHTEIAELLLTKTDLALCDGQGRTPIRLAEELGQKDLVSKMMLVSAK